MSGEVIYCTTGEDGSSLIVTANNAEADPDELVFETDSGDGEYTFLAYTHKEVGDLIVKLTRWYLEQVLCDF